MARVRLGARAPALIVAHHIAAVVLLVHALAFGAGGLGPLVVLDSLVAPVGDAVVVAIA